MNNNRINKININTINIIGKNTRHCVFATTTTTTTTTSSYGSIWLALALMLEPRGRQARAAYVFAAGDARGHGRAATVDAANATDADAAALGGAVLHPHAQHQT